MNNENEQFEFDKKSLDDRKLEFENAKKKCEHQRIPIIVQKLKRSKLVIPAEFKSKILINPSMKFGEFVLEMRKRLKLSAEHSLFFFVKNINPSSSLTVGEIYEKHKDEDGFLKLMFCEEPTFG